LSQRPCGSRVTRLRAQRLTWVAFGLEAQRC